MTNGRARGTTQVQLGRANAVRVVEDPYTSVLALACAGIRDSNAGRDSVFARTVDTLDERGRQALTRLVTPGSSVSPDCLTPPDYSLLADRPAAVVMAEHLDRLRSLGRDEIDDDLDRTYEGHPPAHWAEIRPDPRGWAHAAAAGLQQLWQVVGPEWARQRHLRARELERIATAAVTGTLDVALAAAHPRGRATHGAFEFPDPQGVVTDIGDRTLLISPLLIGLHLTISNLERPDVVFFGYPASPTPPGGPRRLEALISGPRAAVLTRLWRPTTMSDLANALHLSPASTTHHVGWLESCGLVDRHRDGRNVIVTRTGLGTELVAAFEQPR